MTDTTPEETPVLLTNFVFSEIKKVVQTHGWEEYSVTLKFEARKILNGFEARPVQPKTERLANEQRQQSS